MCDAGNAQEFITHEFRLELFVPQARHDQFVLGKYG